MIVTAPLAWIGIGAAVIYGTALVSLAIYALHSLVVAVAIPAASSGRLADRTRRTREAAAC